jgi:N-acetylmuramoyl-L-alanine amidase
MTTPIRQGAKGYLVNEVILHCAAVDGDWHRGKNAAQVKAEIRQWHLARGFADFGYHGLFMPDGTFLEGRPFTRIGAHVMERNRGTLGFLMVESRTITGITRFESWFTAAQRKAVTEKIASIPGIKWVTGHNDYANKLCPGFKVKDEDWL